MGVVVLLAGLSSYYGGIFLLMSWGHLAEAKADAWNLLSADTGPVVRILDRVVRRDRNSNGE